MFETLLSSINDAPSYVQQLWILCGLLLVWLWSTPSNELVGLKTIFSKMLLWVQCIIYMVLSKDLAFLFLYDRLVVLADLYVVSIVAHAW